MRDYAKEITITGYKEGVAVIPYYQHEQTMLRETKKTRRALTLAVALMAAINAAWIFATRKH